MLGIVVQIPFDAAGDIGLAGTAEIVKIRKDHGHQFFIPGVRQDKDLLDGRSLQVMLTHLFGRNFFAGTQDDDVFDPALDKKIAALVQAAEIAAPEPAVLDNGPGGSVVGEIAGHDIVAADENFSHTFGIGPVDFDLYPDQGPAH